MSSILRALGLEPRREARRLPDGRWEIRITAPEQFKLAPVTVVLTAEQYDRFVGWLDGKYLIQEALPTLSDSDREKIMSGLDDRGFAMMTGGKPCPSCGGTGGLYSSHGGKVVDQKCKQCGGTGYVDPEE